MEIIKTDIFFVRINTNPRTEEEAYLSVDEIKKKFIDKSEWTTCKILKREGIALNSKTYLDIHAKQESTDFFLTKGKLVNSAAAIKYLEENKKNIQSSYEENLKLITENQYLILYKRDFMKPISFSHILIGNNFHSLSADKIEKTYLETYK